MNIIEFSQLPYIVTHGAGLLVGPAITSNDSSVYGCAEMLRKEFPEITQGIANCTYYELAEQIADLSNENRQKVREKVIAYFKNLPVNPGLNSIVRAEWRGIVSLSAEPFFFQSLRTYFDGLPTHKNATMVNEPNMVVRAGNVPVYQPLGDIYSLIDEEKLAITWSEYEGRRRTWSRLMRTFTDNLKGAPLFITGTSSIIDSLCHFLSEMIRLGDSFPSRLIFLADDPTPQSPKLRSLVKNWSQIQQVRCSISDFCNTVARPILIQGKIEKDTAINDKFDSGPLREVADQIDFVPSPLPDVDYIANKHRLLDLLFSPTITDWSPYIVDLDFPRELRHSLLTLVGTRFQQTGPATDKCVVVKGEAGSGKTVLLRRLAVDLSKQGHLCVWIRSGMYLGSSTRFQSAVTALNAAVKGKKTSVVIFHDDPIGGRILPQEVLSALTRSHFDWVVVFGVRNSDLAISEDQESGIDLFETETVEVQTNFTQEESKRFPQYLLKLEVAKTEIEAIQLIENLSKRNIQRELLPTDDFFEDSQDLLCALWYLLPQTKSTLTQSLTNEYIRLGGFAGVVQSYIDAPQDRKDVARKAYELVATCSALGVSVPVEVLVSALKISYAAWNDMCGENKPLWGLLFAEEFKEASTWGYRIRNHIVTRILINILNGNMTNSHAGEWRCLKELIGACDSNNIQYREFLCNILVSGRSKLAPRLTYEQGLDLYDLALGTFPIQDRTLGHHRALWIKNKGNDPLLAYRELQAVQNMKEYPLAHRSEPKEHIHTSMASAASKAVSQGRLDANAGFDLVMNHIAHASAPQAFDPHTQHIHAHTLMTMANILREKDNEKCIECLNEAGHIIERSLSILAPVIEKRFELRKEYTLFEELSNDIAIAFTDPDHLFRIGVEIFERSGNQNGLVLASRASYFSAKARGKGKDMNDCQDFINRTISYIEKKGAQVSSKLKLCRAQLFITWRVIGEKKDIPWSLIKDDLKSAVESSVGARDPICIFFLAVAHYQLGEFPMAEVLFSELRRLRMNYWLRSPVRCMYLDENGRPRTFQGTISPESARERFIKCSELGNDIRIRRGEFKVPDGAPVHFHIAFSMMGSIAQAGTQKGFDSDS